MCIQNNQLNPAAFMAGRILAVLVGLLPMAAGADTHHINPADPPEIVLPANEAERLSTLLSPRPIDISGDVSPDGRTALIFDQTPRLRFLELATGRHIDIDSSALNHRPQTRPRWRDADHIATIALNPAGELVMMTIDRGNGAVATEAMAVDGQVMAMSPDTNTLLVARLSESHVPTQSGERAQPRLLAPRRPDALWSRPGPGIATGWTREAGNLRALQSLSLFIVDVSDPSQPSYLPALELARDEAIGPITWSPTGDALTFAHLLDPSVPRFDDEGRDLSVLDALGELAPADNPYLNSNALEIIRMGKGRIRLTTIPAEGEAVFFSASFDPTGRRVLATEWYANHPRGRSYPSFGRANGARHRIYSRWGRRRHEIRDPRFRADNTQTQFLSAHEVLVVTTERQRVSAFHHNLRTGRSKRLQVPDGLFWRFALSPDSKRMVFGFESLLHPPEIWTINPRRGRAEQLTKFNAHVSAMNNIKVTPLRFCLKNGEIRRGHLVEAADERPKSARRTMVVWQEGGPMGAMVNYWGGRVEAPFNLLANFGISVLIVPLPGRDGHGIAFQRQLSDHRNFGAIDIDQQAEIVQSMIDDGYAAQDGVGIVGCSYGGYFAAQSITRHPGLYAAANPQCSLLDLIDEWAFGSRTTIAHFMGRGPQDDLDEYIADSPIERADRVRTPTLLFSGTHDFLPFEFSVAFHDEIEAQGVASDVYLFAGEGHGLRQSSSQFVAAQAQLMWFREHLGHSP